MLTFTQPALYQRQQKDKRGERSGSLFQHCSLGEYCAGVVEMQVYVFSMCFIYFILIHLRIQFNFKTFCFRCVYIGVYMMADVAEETEYVHVQ